MKHTIAQNKQLFNVKAIADSVTIDALADGQFGVFGADATTSEAANATYAQLPDEIRIIARLNGELYYSFDSFKKANIFNANAKAYTAGAVNIWEGTVSSTACACISTATLNINLDEETLMRERGLSWVNRDNVVVSAPKELTDLCDCAGNPTYDNHLITNELYKNINNSESPFYLAKVKYDVSGLTTYADAAARDAAIAAPAGGEIVLVTDVAEMQVYDLASTSWVAVAPLSGILTDATAVEAFITATTALNTDSTAGTDTGKLILVIEGKPATAKNFKDLDVNYIYPRGVKFQPSIVLNGNGPSIEFTETQEIGYEIGAGADLRAEEFDSLSLYTGLNHYPQLSDGIASEDLIYQFENGVNYNTLDFEFVTDKVNRNDGDKRSFGVMLGTSDTGIYNALVTMFKA